MADIKAADARLPSAKELFAQMDRAYPHLTREAVFCWLWDNYDLVDQLRNWNGMGISRVGWDELAKLIADDGVLGARGEPPNANSVRRVWARVRQEKAERVEREGSEQ